MPLHSRIIVGALCCVAGSFLLAAPSAAQTCDSSPLVVFNTSLWTPDGIVANRDVVFRDGRVAAIETANSVRRDGIRRIDGTGHTLLPGLVDAHLHFSIPGGLPAKTTPRADAAEITGRQLLRSGVTSGRLHLASLEDAVRLKQRSSLPCEPMPRLQVGGPGLSGALDKDFPNFQGAKAADDAVAKIERMRAAGIDWVAIHDAERFAPGVLQTIATAARNAGLRVMAGGSTPQEITAVLSVRPDTLDYFDRTAEARYAPAVLDLIKAAAAQSNLVLVPTPGVPYRTTQYLRNVGWLERPTNFEFLDDVDRAFVLANAQKDLAGAEGTRSQRVMTTLADKMQQLRSLGVPMALGSDAGSPLQFQAGAIWWELEAWRSTGASPREALRAATTGGARVLRATDVGTLVVGSRADFVLYRGIVEDGPFDPMRVITVGKSGVLFVADGTWVGPAVRP
jgi:imidazolonepropionase-like amidohydrolase